MPPCRDLLLWLHLFHPLCPPRRSLVRLGPIVEAAQGVLLGFGTTVEVLEPQELRDSMGDLAAAIAALYSKEIRNSQIKSSKSNKFV